MFAAFEKLLNPFPDGDDAAPPKKLVGFCWHYVRDARWALVAIGVLTAAIGASEVLLFAFLGDIVNWLSSADRSTFLANEGGRLAGMAFVLLVVLPALGVLHSLVMHQTLAGNLPMSARWRMHRRLLRQSTSFFNDEFAGRVSTKVMQTALAVREAAFKFVDIFVYVTVYFLATIALVASSDWRLAAPLIAWLGVYFALLAYFVPKLRDVSQRQADARSAMTGRIVDSYTNISTVKLFAHAGAEENYARESMRGFLNTVHPQMRLVTLLNAGVETNNYLVVFAVSALGIAFWLGGAVSVGVIAAAVALALRLNGMSHWIMWEVAALFENVGTIYDGMAMLTKPISVTDRADAERLAPAHGAIRFEDVSFHYGKGGGVIDKLNLEIASGEKVGLVGRSGAGKSTLVNLLLRLFDVEAGRILIDGRDVARVTQESLRAQIGMVTQDTALLHRSIRDNIAYGRPDAGDDEIRDAARRANALEFIETLEDGKGRRGFDAMVGERGLKLSGGQRQRIAIARVFLKDAPILVLDEATSALDSEIEAAIQENLFDLMEGKTVIAIAHRLSTIAALDRLVVLDRGAIVEEGAHDDLVGRGGLYADLWARQSGGFLTGAAPAQAKAS
ncbi:MAG: ABC transporter ATP-binding protein [Parvularculaceae bacterium]